MNPFRDNHDPMTCAGLRAVIDDYIDGDLGAEASRAFEHHLGACEACRSEFVLAGRVLEAVRALPPQACPDRVRERVLEEARASDASTRRSPGGRERRRVFAALRPAVVFALVLLASVAPLVKLPVERPTETITPEEVARAEAQIKWTLGYLNDLGRWTGHTVKNDVIEERLLPEMRRAVKAALEAETMNHPAENGGSV